MKPQSDDGSADMLVGGHHVVKLFPMLDDLKALSLNPRIADPLRFPQALSRHNGCLPAKRVPSIIPRSAWRNTERMSAVRGYAAIGRVTSAVGITMRSKHAIQEEDASILSNDVLDEILIRRAIAAGIAKTLPSRIEMTRMLGISLRTFHSCIKRGGQYHRTGCGRRTKLSLEETEVVLSWNELRRLVTKCSLYALSRQYGVNARALAKALSRRPSGKAKKSHFSSNTSDGIGKELVRQTSVDALKFLAFRPGSQRDRSMRNELLRRWAVPNLPSLQLRKRSC